MIIPSCNLGLFDFNLFKKARDKELIKPSKKELKIKPTNGKNIKQKNYYFKKIIPQLSFAKIRKNGTTS